MGHVINTGRGVVAPAQTGRVGPVPGGHIVGTFRLPADPLFYADLTLRNVVAGSRYRVTRSDTGAELATGVAAGSGLVDVEITGVAAYANPQEVDITVRKATGAPYYKIFNTSAFLAKSGGEAYILQTED